MILWLRRQKDVDLNDVGDSQRIQLIAICIWTNVNLLRTWSIQLRWDITPESLIEDSRSDQKKLFWTIDQLLDRKPMKLYPSCSSDAELANRFANFFDGNFPWSGRSSQSSRYQFLLHLQLLIHLNLTANWTLTYQQLSVDELSEIMQSTLSKSCSLDPLPSKLVISNLDVLMPVICNIVNLSLDSSRVPPSMKEAVLQPLLKKPPLDHEIYKNFRPVSNLEMITKVTEKVAATRLNHYLEVNNLNNLPVCL